jgi:hypothetical protein
VEVEEEELGLEEGGKEQKKSKLVLSPHTRKMTDRRRVMGYEFEPSVKWTR